MIPRAPALSVGQPKLTPLDGALQCLEQKSWSSSSVVQPLHHARC
jgi:hypothetical protein